MAEIRYVTPLNRSGGPQVNHTLNALHTAAGLVVGGTPHKSSQQQQRLLPPPWLTGVDVRGEKQGGLLAAFPRTNQRNAAAAAPSSRRPPQVPPLKAAGAASAAPLHHSLSGVLVANSTDRFWVAPPPSARVVCEPSPPTSLRAGSLPSSRLQQQTSLPPQHSPQQQQQRPPSPSQLEDRVRRLLDVYDKRQAERDLEFLTHLTDLKKLLTAQKAATSITAAPFVELKELLSAKATQSQRHIEELLAKAVRYRPPSGDSTTTTPAVELPLELMPEGSKSDAFPSETLESDAARSTLADASDNSTNAATRRSVKGLTKRTGASLLRRIAIDMEAAKSDLASLIAVVHQGLEAQVIEVKRAVERSSEQSTQLSNTMTALACNPSGPVTKHLLEIVKAELQLHHGKGEVVVEKLLPAIEAAAQKQQQELGRIRSALPDRQTLRIDIDLIVEQLMGLRVPLDALTASMDQSHQWEQDHAQLMQTFQQLLLDAVKDVEQKVEAAAAIARSTRSDAAVRAEMNSLQLESMCHQLTSLQRASRRDDDFFSQMTSTLGTLLKSNNGLSGGGSALPTQPPTALVAPTATQAINSKSKHPNRRASPKDAAAAPAISKTDTAVLLAQLQQMHSLGVNAIVLGIQDVLNHHFAALSASLAEALRAFEQRVARMSDYQCDNGIRAVVRDEVSRVLPILSSAADGENSGAKTILPLTNTTGATATSSPGMTTPSSEIIGSNPANGASPNTLSLFTDDVGDNYNCPSPHVKDGVVVHCMFERSHSVMTEALADGEAAGESASSGRALGRLRSEAPLVVMTANHVVHPSNRASEDSVLRNELAQLRWMLARNETTAKQTLEYLTTALESFGKVLLQTAAATETRHTSGNHFHTGDDSQRTVVKKTCS